MWFVDTCTQLFCACMFVPFISSIACTLHCTPPLPTLHLSAFPCHLCSMSLHLLPSPPLNFHPLSSPPLLSNPSLPTFSLLLSLLNYSPPLPSFSSPPFPLPLLPPSPPPPLPHLLSFPLPILLSSSQLLSSPSGPLFHASSILPLLLPSSPLSHYFSSSM